jgi:hypothetical protein
MFLSALLLILPVALAVVLPNGPSHELLPQLASATWYHPPDHPAYNLFKRDPSTDGAQYPPVGSASSFASRSYPP